MQRPVPLQDSEQRGERWQGTVDWAVLAVSVTITGLAALLALDLAAVLQSPMVGNLH